MPTLSPSAADRPRVTGTTVTTPLGPMVAAATDDAVVLLEFADRRMLLRQLGTVRSRFGQIEDGAHPLLHTLQAQLDAYFAGDLREFGVPIEAPGSDFQRRVWDALREIPYGETVSYAQLARRVDEPRASRAVGWANGSNRIAIVIPCHRVVNSGGGLGGYGGGLWRKERLLALERAATPA